MFEVALIFWSFSSISALLALSMPGSLFPPRLNAIDVHAQQHFALLRKSAVDRWPGQERGTATGHDAQFTLTHVLDRMTSTSTRLRCVHAD